MGGPLGVIVDKDCGESLVVCSFSEGHVTEWNRSVAKKVRVKVGDRIDSFNGVVGKDWMLAQLQQPVQLVMRLTEPVVTRIHCRDPLGVEFYTKKEASALAVAEIKFGSVLAWNLKYPQQAVVTNDHLIQVDQSRDSSTEMESALREGDSWNLLFRRYSTKVHE